MKPHYILIFLLFTSMSLSTVNAQEQTSQLIGTWTLDYNASVARMPQQVKARFDSLPASRSQRIKNTYQGRKITFSADNNFNQTLTDGRSMSGQWQFNGSQQLVKITSPQGKVFPYKVIALNTTTLILELLTTHAGKSYFKQQVYIKPQN